MKPWRPFPVIAAAVWASACASAPAVVPVAGPPSEVRQLEGRWLGEYASSATGREGTLVFELQGGGDAATGHVWMTQQPETVGLSLLGTPAMIARPLAIRFVLVEGSAVSGTLDPYLDPLTGYRLLTTFQGRLDGNVITGTFVTANWDTGEKVSGDWSARRVRQPQQPTP